MDESDPNCAETENHWENDSRPSSGPHPALKRHQETPLKQLSPIKHTGKSIRVTTLKNKYNYSIILISSPPTNIYINYTQKYRICPGAIVLGLIIKTAI